MNRDNAMTGQPVRSLQTMLRQLSRYYPNLPYVIPDGIFEEETLAAVMTFQREFRLPVTGVVDAAVWKAIVDAYEEVLEKMQPLEKITGLPEVETRIEPGEVNPNLWIIQAMFQALEGVFVGIAKGPVHQVHSGVSVQNVLWLQRHTGLPQNGVIDNRTWNYLSRLYRQFVTRRYPAEKRENGVVSAL